MSCFFGNYDAAKNLLASKFPSEPRASKWMYKIWKNGGSISFEFNFAPLAETLIGAGATTQLQ